MKPTTLLLCIALAVTCGNARSQTAPTEPETSQPVSLSELAAMADVIVLAQARDTDYIYRRDFPVKGSAYLHVLIPYKVDQPLEIIEVFEEGLHQNECYFPNPTVFEEGRRYLLFLKKDPESNERYRGLQAGCALDVLVTSDNRYALRIPVTGVELSDSLDQYSQRFKFSDSYAIVTDESITSTERENWEENGWLEPSAEGYTFTQGVDIAIIRQLMGADGVSLDRHQKRLEPEVDSL